METISVYVGDDEELVEEFDDLIWELKTEGKIDREASRSEVIKKMMEGVVEGNSNLTGRPLNGNRPVAASF